ncbi:peptide MFS transporter [Haliangium sp.]|uniref:peptide MFS transporter n=1 Tax=Haliangium sp. TaxID=2663208 RepID=UPI003D0E9A22
MTEANPALAQSVEDRSFFGHPRALATLFFTELWERFSYYGMRALLILFMTDAATGLAMDDDRAGAIYGLYTFGVYALALPGGWIADRLIGKKRAVLYGGILIALGHYSLAVPALFTFYLGLFLIVLGTGLLKPNVSAIVGDLYSDKGARRDAGFSIFYMGINFGAMFGPLVCAWLGESERFGWHWGFGAAGVGMTLALIAYIRGYRGLAGKGEMRGEMAEKLPDARRKFVLGLGVVTGFVAVLVGLSYGGVLPLTLDGFASMVWYVVSAIMILYIVWTIVWQCRDTDERKRVGVCAFLFIGYALFMAGFEQAGSSMTLFTERLTDRNLFGWLVPTGALQSINPLFIIIMAPVMGSLWVWLGKRNPSIPAKFAYGLLLLGAGFLVLAWGSSTITEDGQLVGMRWLVVTYFLHTVGELCLSPVGLSSVTKLAPDRLVSQMMGTWFMGAALGNLIAGLTAGFIDDLGTSTLFLFTGGFVIAAGLLFVILTPTIRKLTGDIN